MLRNDSRLLGYLAPIALVALSASSVFAQKTTLVPVSSAPLTLSLKADSNIISACADGGAPQLRLTANAVSPGGNPIKYRWTTSAGTIIGEGPVVTWNMAGLKPGYHKASLDIQSVGVDGFSCQAFQSVNVLVNPCAVVQPVCPAVEIVCPTNLNLGQPLTFSSRVTGGIPATTNAIYNWTVSAGTIISGQGTDTITVDGNGLGGQSITATLSVGGYNLECAGSCSVMFPLPRGTSRLFDDFTRITPNNEKARLDNLGIALQNEPGAVGYVIVYPGRSSKRGEVQHQASRIVDYLVNSRGLEEGRIKTLVGPPRNELYVELWITPQGATPPNPTKN